MLLYKLIKGKLKEIFLKNGYQITRINKHLLQHNSPFFATTSCIKINQPIIFDIGMNHGQTLRKITEVYPNAVIHGFEPNRNCYEELLINFSNKNIYINNLGVGNESGFFNFNAYSWDALGSFLNHAYAKSQIIEKYQAEVITIDEYAKTNDVKKIHILKSDTEGFELKVLKGAETLLNENRVQFIFLELFFESNFINQSSVGEIFKYLEGKGFSLVRFYDFSFSNDGLASKADALFFNEKFKT